MVHFPLRPPTSAAALCNQECRCITTDRDALSRTFPDLDGAVARALADRPNLFAASAVFVTPAEAAAMTRVVDAVEAAVRRPGFRAAMLAGAPAIAWRDPGARGAFISYDFHLAPEGPRLIEINTNAGGALLSAGVARAQQSCCPGSRPHPGLAGLEDALFGMFLSEWRLQRGGGAPGLIAIVDDEPEAQFLYAEFLLMRAVFRSRGLAAEIADARRLAWRDGRLWLDGTVVDLVYNRSCDFYFDDPAHTALRAAYETGATVVTPHPHAHAVYADKRALILLSDAESLAAWEVDDEARRVLGAGVPRTVAVTPDRAEALWAARGRLFFKPATGYGSRAAYRGDKLTRRVWQSILAGRYVAQDLAPPSERHLRMDGVDTAMKIDLRNFVYDGRVQFLSARLYRGQTTNFQTPGGGLAAVRLIAEDEPEDMSPGR